MSQIKVRENILEVEVSLNIVLHRLLVYEGGPWPEADAVRGP